MTPLREDSTNRLIATMPPATLERWATRLTALDLRAGQVLYEAGVPNQHVYFPITAVVSVLHVLSDGATAEIALIGHEGVVGLSHCIGDGGSPMRAMVQVGGRALRLPFGALRAEFDLPSGAKCVLMRYMQALVVQMAQTAACNRHHSIEQQVCRWLLSSLDRTGGSELHMTQELIGSLLGVRREGVALAAARLQREGAIRYSRGHIHVTDRALLERHTCECYSAVASEYTRLLRAGA